MAPSAVLGRIKKLEDRGIIDGYEVRLYPDHFNQAMIAFIQIKLKDPTVTQDTCRTLSKIENVQEVHQIAGEDCIMIKLRTSDTRELERLLSLKIYTVGNILSTKTSIALSTYKESAQIVIPEKTGDK